MCKQRNENYTWNFEAPASRGDANLFDANNSCGDEAVDFWRHYKSKIFFITSISFPMENETMECEPSVIRSSQRRENKSSERRREKDKDMDARLVTRIIQDRDAMETRSDTGTPNWLQFQKIARRTSQKSLKRGIVSPLENWVTTYGLCWSLLSPISRIVVSHSVI